MAFAAARLTASPVRSGDPEFRRPGIDVDQHGGPGRLDMNRPAAVERYRPRQRLIEDGGELD